MCGCMQRLKIARATASVTVERPLLRCRFRAGYLVRGCGAAAAGEAGVGGQPRVARQRQLGHSGPAPPPNNYVHARYRTRVFQSHPYLIGHHEAGKCV